MLVERKRTRRSESTRSGARPAPASTSPVTGSACVCQGVRKCQANGSNACQVLRGRATPAPRHLQSSRQDRAAVGRIGRQLAEDKAAVGSSFQGLGL
jgi:hypothetical protein